MLALTNEEREALTLAAADAKLASFTPHEECNEGGGEDAPLWQSLINRRLLEWAQFENDGWEWRQVVPTDIGLRSLRIDDSFRASGGQR